MTRNQRPFASACNKIQRLKHSSTIAELLARFPQRLETPIKVMIHMVQAEDKLG